MQHFTLLSAQPTNWRKAKLITASGEPLILFDRYVRHLIRKGISNSAGSGYMGHAARFIDFCEAKSQKGFLLATSIYDLALEYEQYLLHEDIDLDGIPRKRTSPTSLPVIEAALKHFVRIYEAAPNIDFFAVTTKIIQPTYSPNAQAKMKQHSLLGSVIRGSGEQRDRSKAGLFITVKSNRSQNTNAVKSFELDSIHLLFEGAKSHRDKCLYALLASGGIRTYEAEQLRIHPDHIDIKEQKIFIRSPFLESLPELSLDEWESLHWKGRSVNEVFLVAPWKALFFKHLDDYLTHEYNPHTDHDFLFQILKGPRKYRPLFTRCRSSKIDNFDSACLRMDIVPTKQSKLHSLRHSYGDYLYNWIPTPSGLGMPETYVWHNLGHADDRQMPRYAKLNIDSMNEKLRESEALLNNAEQIDTDTLRIEHYEREIQKIKNKTLGKMA